MKGMVLVMSKWIKMYTNDLSKDGNDKKRFKTAERVLRNTKRLSFEELQKECVQAGKDAAAREESYKDAEAKGKLWSQEKKDVAKAEKKAARKEKRVGV